MNRDARRAAISTIYAVLSVRLVSLLLLLLDSDYYQFFALFLNDEACQVSCLHMQSKFGILYSRFYSTQIMKLSAILLSVAIAALPAAAQVVRSRCPVNVRKKAASLNTHSEPPTERNVFAFIGSLDGLQRRMRRGSLRNQRRVCSHYPRLHVCSSAST
jgi:hypothetical protein